MKLIPSELKQALYWFVDSISKGMLENENWDFEPTEKFDNGDLDWAKYVAACNDPTVAKTAYTIWMNTIQLDRENRVLNESYATFRAFQYLRTHFDDTYNHDDITPPLTSVELDESQF